MVYTVLVKNVMGSMMQTGSVEMQRIRTVIRVPEEDVRIFGDFFNIWKEYREKRMTEQDWIEFGDKIAACAMLHHFETNPLAAKIGTAVLEAMGDLYMNGAVPKIADYFGQG